MTDFTQLNGTVTTTVAATLPPGGVPIVGLEDGTFHIIHVAAISCLVSSIVASVYLLVVKLLVSRRLWTLPIGERLVVYLAMGDLLFSCSHVSDHSVMVATLGSPPHDVCVIMGLILCSFLMIPSIIVFFTALNAFSMVVKQKKLSLGRYDWRLLVSAFIFPFVVMAIAAANGLLGASGAWCGIYFGSREGILMSQIFGILTLGTFLTNLLFYGLIAFKIRQVPKVSSESSGASAAGAQKYQKTIRVMMLFVVAYMIQYWSLALISIWLVFAFPPFWLFMTTVTFTNVGGLFNFAVYFFIRRKYTSTGSGGESTAGGDGTSVATATTEAK